MCKKFFVFFNIFKYKIFFLSILLLSFFSICYAGEPVVDGSIPPWIGNAQNPLVQRMRDLSASGLGTYFPHTNPYVTDEGPICNQIAWARWKVDHPNETPDTTCAYACSIALRGTPYGASEEYELNWDEWHYGEDIINVDIFRDKAEELGQWRDSSYEPKPGDLAITNNGGHIIMITETIGSIGGGSGTAAKMGVRGLAEWSYVPGKAIGYIETSGLPISGGLSWIVDWGLDALATIGDSLNELVKQFTIIADNALQAMSSIGTLIIFSLIMIDFATFFLLNGFDFNLSIFISKLMKYTFLLFIFVNWSDIVNIVFLDFAEHTSSVFADGNTTEYLTQPQFLLKKGVEAVSPALNFISTAPEFSKMSWDNFKNVPFFLFMILLTLITLASLIFSAMYLAYIFIEFYLMAAFNAVFMIFPTLRFTKFIAEGGIGGLVHCMIKLLVAGCLVCSISAMTKDAKFAIEFPAAISGLNSEILFNYIYLCGHIMIIVAMIIIIPYRIAMIYSGKVRFPD